MLRCPRVFRAHSIDRFHKTHGAASALRLHCIRRAGRSIATPPADAKMAATIKSFVGRTDPLPASQFVGIGGEQIFRTTYPSIARERRCVTPLKAIIRFSEMMLSGDARSVA
jgi:hypothetical protein